VFITDHVVTTTFISLLSCYQLDLSKSFFQFLRDELKEIERGHGLGQNQVCGWYTFSLTALIAFSQLINPVQSWKLNSISSGCLIFNFGEKKNHVSNLMVKYLTIFKNCDPLFHPLFNQKNIGVQQIPTKD
jgi:hypothetical protein